MKRRIISTNERIFIEIKNTKQIQQQNYLTDFIHEDVFEYILSFITNMNDLKNIYITICDILEINKQYKLPTDGNYNKIQKSYIKIMESNLLKYENIVIFCNNKKIQDVKKIVYTDVYPLRRLNKTNEILNNIQNTMKFHIIFTFINNRICQICNECIVTKQYFIDTFDQLLVCHECDIILNSYIMSPLITIKEIIKKTNGYVFVDISTLKKLCGIQSFPAKERDNFILNNKIRCDHSGAFQYRTIGNSRYLLYDIIPFIIPKHLK